MNCKVKLHDAAFFGLLELNLQLGKGQADSRARSFGKDVLEGLQDDNKWQMLSVGWDIEGSNSSNPHICLYCYEKLKHKY